MKKSNKNILLSGLSVLLLAAGCTTTATVVPNPTASATVDPTTSPTASVMPTAEPTVVPTTSPTATAMPTAMPSPSPSANVNKTVYALDNNNTLYRISSSIPSTVNSSVVINGLQPLEKIIGIDFRPSDKRLYGIGTSNRVYIIDPATGGTTVIGGAFNPVINGTTFGFDFNPVADRIRLHSNTEQNLRLNPVNGVVAFTDTNLAYADNDLNAGANPNIVGSAYTNSASGATSTQLYAIDSDRDILVKFENPDSGKMTTVGPLGVNTNDNVGFDIDASSGVAYAALNIGGGISGLYTVNLNTGAVSQIENIGTNNPIRGIAVDSN